MICEVCKFTLASQRVPPKDTLDDNEHPQAHHQTLASLKHSVELGCYVCNRVWINLCFEERRLTPALGADETRNHTDFVDGVVDRSVDAPSTISTVSRSQNDGYLWCIYFHLKIPDFPRVNPSDRKGVMFVLDQKDGKQFP